MQHGRWTHEETVHDQFRRWVGEYGGMPDARITLIDEEIAGVLVTWPDQR